MRPPRMRTVICDPRFDAELRQIESDVQKADDFIEGAERILSRSPESGHCLGPQAHVWFLSGHTVDAAIFYTFDENNVYLLSIRKVPPIET